MRTSDGGLDSLLLFYSSFKSASFESGHHRIKQLVCQGNSCQEILPSRYPVISVPGVGYAVERREAIVRASSFLLPSDFRGFL